LEGDFPITSGKNALLKLRDVFFELEKQLVRAGHIKGSAALVQIADTINLKVLQVLPILGFILRSTNVRNAFEVLEPLQTIADAALQGTPQLLLSSEWDYVPFAYPQSLDDLKSFVLIGLPASEAGSALLLPLAAHELGHAVWRHLGIDGSAGTTLQLRCEKLYEQEQETFKKVFPDYNPTDMLSMDVLPDAIARSVEYAVRQSEELFCDMFAYAAFGVSYLYAFAYILAPGGEHRDADYPLFSTRISVLLEIAKNEGDVLPTAAELNFGSETRRGDGRHQFIVRKAEESVSGITSALWEKVLEIFQKSDLQRPNRDLADRHLHQFRIGIPAHEPACLGDIINAGWLRHAEILKEAKSSRKVSEGLDHLNELLLKTVEVLEYRRRVS